MKAFHLMFFFLLFQSSLLAQRDIQVFDEIHFHQLMLGEKAVFNDYSNIQGSPYLDQKFVESKVLFKNDSIYRIALRYNIFDQRMEYKYDHKVYNITNPQDLKKIELGDKTFIYFYSKKESKYEAYYQVLIEGKASLLLKRDITFRKEEKSNGIVEGKPNRFLKSPDKYFVYISGGDLQLIKNKKSIPIIFQSKHKEMNAFVKKERISFKKQNDLIQLVAYYNKLND